MPTVGYCPNCGREVKNTSHKFDDFYFCQNSCKISYLLKSSSDDLGSYRGESEEERRRREKKESEEYWKEVEWRNERGWWGPT
jgi:hypothetical protein